MKPSRKLLGIGLLLGLCHGATARDEPAKPGTRTDRMIEGWTIGIDDRLLMEKNQVLGGRVLKSLEGRLSDIKAVVSDEPLQKLQTFKIMLDLNHGTLKPMQYHPGLEWLKDNGYAGELHRCVHIPVAAALIEPRQINVQPWCVLHELAHAYHDQVLGFEEARIDQAYEEFKKSGRGDAALLITGERVRHYGLTNSKEFFAEMTEAYFGTNDFFPFNRGELMTAEPAIYQLMADIWGPVKALPKEPKPETSMKTGPPPLVPAGTPPMPGDSSSGE